MATAKHLSRTLAFRFHPDRGGDTSTMHDINVQYDALLQPLDGQITIGTDGEFHRYTYKAEWEREIMAIIDQLLRFTATDTEIVAAG